MELEMEFIRKLPSPQELKMEHPVDPGLYQIKTRRDSGNPGHPDRKGCPVPSHHWTLFC